LELPTTGTLAEKRDLICERSGVLLGSSLSEFLAQEAAEARAGLRWESCQCRRVTGLLLETDTDEDLGERLQNGDIQMRCRCPYPAPR